MRTPKTTKLQIVERATGVVLDADAVPTAFLCAKGGPAIKRDGCWFETRYEGFVVRDGEQIYDVRVRATRG
jgi:hypothetical protein